MGSQSSRIVFDADEWERTGELRFSSIIRHRSTQEQLERYLVGEDALSQSDRELFTVRKNNRSGWVPILYHFREPLSNLCNGRGGSYVITQRLERLSDLKRKLTNEEGMILLREALHSYGSLVSQFGYFNITAGMMALNSRGELRVWFNENFSSNQKTVDKNQKLDCLSLIQSILKVITDRVEGCDFQWLFEGRSRLNFVEAVRVLTQYSLKQKQGMGYLSVCGSKRTRGTLKNNQNEYSLRVHTDESYQKESNSNIRCLDHEQISNKSLVVLPSATRQDKSYKQLDAAHHQNLVFRHRSPQYYTMKSPPCLRKQLSTIEEAEVTQPSQLQLSLEPLISRQGNHRPRLATICSSPEVKHTPLPTVDNRCFRSIAYEQIQGRQPVQGPHKPSNISETACQTIDCPQQEVVLHRLGGTKAQKSSSRKSLSMWLPSKKDLSFHESKRMNMYEDIQRIDSVLMLGSSTSSENEPTNVVVIESTILRS